eukprot:SAG31_NODE_4398_length_3239_cov_6.414380_5_plen_62_part_00
MSSEPSYPGATMTEEEIAQIGVVPAYTHNEDFAYILIVPPMGVAAPFQVPVEAHYTIADIK